MRQGDHYLITLKDGVSATRLLGKLGALGGKVRRSNDRIGIVSAQNLTAQAAASLAADADVESVVRDVDIQWLGPAPKVRFARTVAATPLAKPDPSQAAFFPLQWNMVVIRASAAWPITNQGLGTLVCTLDTGVDPTHIDLAGRVDLNHSISLVPTEPEITDFFFHGTAVAALITSNGIGTASVAPQTKICAVKVLDKTGTGDFDAVISGIVFATDAGADVINMSFGAVISKKEPGAKQLIKALQRAINFATKRGVLLVAAAGNESIDFNTAPKDLIAIPAELDGVLSVGATAPVNQQNFDNLASYTNFGSDGIQVVAPGGDFVAGGVLEDLILAPCSSFSDPAVLGFDCSDKLTYLFASGTSFSTPHASGEGAVVDGQTKRPDSSDKLTHCIEVGADAVTGRRFDPVFAFGRIDLLGGIHCRHFI